MALSLVSCGLINLHDARVKPLFKLVLDVDCSYLFLPLTGSDRILDDLLVRAVDLDPSVDALVIHLVQALPQHLTD